MNLQHTKPGNRIEAVKTAAKAFATAALLTATIFGCDAAPSKAVKQIDTPLPAATETTRSKSLEVKCAPCPDCTVPEDATLLKRGSIIGTTKQVQNVLVLRGIDRSTVEARYEKATASIPVKEIETFTVGPGELCTATVSGKEVYDIFKPGAFVAEPGWVFLSSKRAKLYVESKK